MMQAPIRKIAIIYDDACPYTTGIYCRRALMQMGFIVDYYIPEDVDNIPQTYDLYLNIDDNERYFIPKHLSPSAYWVIDTHSDYEWRFKKARTFDFVFAAQKEGSDRLKRDGIENVFWLPLACDPDIHKRYDAAKEYAISFIGSVDYSKKRIDYLSSIKKILKGENIFIGEASAQDTALIYAKSKLVFNITIKDDINMRVFEVLSCGRPLITNDLPNKGQKELFTDKPPFIAYKSKKDLLKKITYYLSHEDEREEIARKGWQEAINKHTYLHRMKEIIRTVEERKNRIKYNDFAEDVSAIMDDTCGKIFNLIGENKKVLHIGCAAGKFSRYLVSEKKCFVTGIEKDPLLAEKAKRVLSEVILGDAGEADTYESIKYKYDFILFMDLPEYTNNPEHALLKIKDFLEEGGKVILTGPNSAYWAIRKGLLLGRFNYNPAHFFTFYSIKHLIEDYGYRIRYFDILYDFPIINSTHRFFAKIIKNSLIKKVLGNIARSYPNLFAYHFLLVIEKGQK